MSLLYKRPKNSLVNNVTILLQWDCTILYPACKIEF